MMHESKGQRIGKAPSLHLFHTKSDQLASDDALSDIDKFNYLKSLLECTVHEAISGLTLTLANYHDAEFQY